MKKVLSDRFLKSIEPSPAGKRPILWDAVVPGLGVRVTERGHKSFIVVRRRPGDKQPLRHTIGPYNPDAEAGTAGTLAHARSQARDALAAIVSGKRPEDVEAERRREEARQRRDLFGSVAEEFIRLHVSKLRSATSYEHLIRRELIKPWGDRPIAEITRHDVVALAEAHRSRYTARKIIAAVSKLYNWALFRDFGLEQNPVIRGLREHTLGTFEPRPRVLGDAELRAVWRAAGEEGYAFGTLVKLLLLTGLRLNELARARWGEIDGAILTVPAARMKGKAAHAAPLVPTGAALLASAPRFAGGDYIFSTTAGRRPISGISKMKRRLDRRIGGIAPWVVHDLRRTVRTRLSGLKVLPVVAELVIGHRQRGISAVYDVHTYDSEKREALERWEKALLEIVEPRGGKVVPIRRAKRR